MKIKLLSVLLFTAYLGCKKSENLRTNEIAYGKCQYFDTTGLTVCFVSLNEYRCPCNADCVWEGSADAGMKITSAAGIDTTVVLTELVSLGKHTTAVGGHTIKLEKVEVADFCNDYGRAEKYKIRVQLD